MDLYEHPKANEILLRFFTHLLVVFFLGTLTAVAAIERGREGQRGISQSFIELNAELLDADGN